MATTYKEVLNLQDVQELARKRQGKRVYGKKPTIPENMKKYDRIYAQQMETRKMLKM